MNTTRPSLRARIAREVRRQVAAQQRLGELEQQRKHFEAELFRSQGALAALEEDYAGETGNSINDGMQTDTELKALVEGATPTALPPGEETKP